MWYALRYLNLLIIDPVPPPCRACPPSPAKTKGVDLENSLKTLRQTYEGEEAGKVYDAFRSHAAIGRKNRLLLTLLDAIKQANAEASS